MPSFARIFVLCVLLLALLAPFQAEAQCVMCKASVQSSEKIEAYTKGINNGILYMAVFPYLLIGLIGYIWYRNYKKFQKNKLLSKNARKLHLKSSPRL